MENVYENPTEAVTEVQGPVPYLEIFAMYRQALACATGWVGERRETAISSFLFRKGGQSTTSVLSRGAFPCPNKRTMPPQGSDTIEKRLTFSLADCIKGKSGLSLAGPSLSFPSLSLKREISKP